MVAHPFHRGLGEPSLISRVGVALNFTERLVATDGGKLMRSKLGWRLASLLRADIYEGVVAPLTLLAKQWFAIGCSAAGACRRGLLADGATRDRMLVPSARHSKREASCRLRQSNRHANCKQRYRESPKHEFFPPPETIAQNFI